MENDNVLIVHNNAKSDVAWFLFSETLTVLRTRLIPLGSNCRRFPWKKIRCCQEWWKLGFRQLWCI